MSTKIYGKITVIKRNGANGSQFPVTGSTCTFGRESDCEIRIQLPNVSSHECQLLADENGRFAISKLNKKGEILVNDKALATQVCVNHNDVLTIAGRSFRFEYPPQQREKMAAAAKVVAGTPRPSIIDRLRQTERRRVSFGPQLSPEQFDLKLPPNTPVKKGAIPMKNLSNTDDISQHRSTLKSAKRKSVNKSASPKATDGKKEKSAKKRSFDKLVEFVGLDKPKKAQPDQTKGNATKIAAPDQLDFFGAVKKTPKAAVTSETKGRHASLQTSSESKQNETGQLEEATPVAKKKLSTTAEKRRSMSNSATPADHEIETDASKLSKTPDQKKRRSKVGTPQPLKEASQNIIEDELKTDDNEVAPQKEGSRKVSGDLDDTLPAEAGEVKPATPAQKQRSVIKDNTLAVQDDASDAGAATSTKKKRRSKVATPQPSGEVCDTSLPGSITTSNDHSDVIQGDKNEPITPKQKRKSMSKIATPAEDEEGDKSNNSPKALIPKTPVQVAEASKQESVTPLQKRRSMSKSTTPKSAKKDDSRTTSSAAATPKVSELSTPAEKCEILSKQQLDSLDNTVAMEDTLPIDDPKKIVLIVQEQTPARQLESAPQSPDMILEIGVQTPAAALSSKMTPRLSRRSTASRSETPSVKVEQVVVETPVAAPSSKKISRLSRRSMTAYSETLLAKAKQASVETPALSSKKAPRLPRRSKTPSVETAQRARRSMIADAAKSLYQIPSNSAILTARRKSLRRRKSGVLLWSDVVRKNTNRHLESKTEPVQLQKVTKASRRSLPRTPKQAQNLRHVDSPATIYIGRRTRPRRNFTPAPLDMSGDWTSDDGNTTVEDSFILSQSAVNNAEETMDNVADPRARTPKVKGQPVQDHFGTKRLLKTPRDKVKEQSVEEHFGTKRLLKTPKEKVKGQPVEEHFGTKRLLKTPKDKVKGQLVEEHFGTKRLLKTPQDKVKGQPVEEHFGTKRLLKTPKDKVKGQPVDEHFGTKRLLRTPVDKVKGVAVQDGFGTKRLFCSPKVKGQPVEYNFGTKRLLNVPETKRKNEPVEDDLCLEQIFGYDVDETSSDLEKTQPSMNGPPVASKAPSGKTPKAKSTKSLTVDTEENPVERVHARTRKSERKQSSDTESDSNEKRATRHTKVKFDDVMEIESGCSSRKRKQSDDSDSSESAPKKRDARSKKCPTTKGSAAQENADHQASSEASVGTPNTRRSSRSRVQQTSVDTAEKPKALSPKTKLTAIPEVEEPAEAVDAESAPVEQSSGEQVQAPRRNSKRTNAPAMKAAENPSTKQTVKKQNKSEMASSVVAKTKSASTRNRMNAGTEIETKGTKPKPSVKTAKKPKQLDDDVTIEIEKVSKKAEDDVDSALSKKTADNKPPVRSSRRGKAAPVTTAAKEVPEPKKSVKKTQSVSSKKAKATEKSEASQPTRAARRGRPSLSEAANKALEASQDEPAAKKATKQPETPARRATRGRKSEPVEDDRKEEVKETAKQATTTRKRKTSDTDALDTKKTADVKLSTRKQKTSDEDASKTKEAVDAKRPARKQKTSDEDASKTIKTTEAKPSRANRSTAAAPEPVRKSTRVRKAK